MYLAAFRRLGMETILKETGDAKQAGYAQLHGLAPKQGSDFCIPHNKEQQVSLRNVLVTHAS